MQPVKIENDAIAVEIWPRIGGKVSSIIDKADQFELLFSCPAEMPDAPRYDLPYADHLYSGWDECFPAIAPGKYPRHPYDGIAVPDHGELWGIPATTAVPTKNGVTTVWNGLRFGYRLVRKLYLDGLTIVAEYSLTNLAPFEFRFVWAMHALLAMSVPVELRCPTARTFRLSYDDQGNSAAAPFEWPRDAEGKDYSQPAKLPDKKAWKLYSIDPIQDPFEIFYPTRNRLSRLEFFSAGISAYWGIWLSTGGAQAHRLISIQPTTGRYDAIDQAIKDNSAGNVQPFEKQEWSIRWTLNAGSDLESPNAGGI